MIAVVFHPEAVEEMEAQALFYEARSLGLGKRFLTEVEAAVERAASMPSIGSPYLHGTRRVFPRSFPHSIIYRLANDLLVVVAIAAFKRKPDHWRQRMQPASRPLG